MFHFKQKIIDMQRNKKIQGGKKQLIITDAGWAR